MLHPSLGHEINWKLSSLKVAYCFRQSSQKKCLHEPNSLNCVKMYDSSQIKQVYLFRMASGKIKWMIVDKIVIFFYFPVLELLFLELLIESTSSLESLIFEFLLLISSIWLPRSEKKEIFERSLLFLFDLSERLIFVEFYFIIAFLIL